MDNKQKVMDKWAQEHGAVVFDKENRTIILPEGGLFSIDKKKIRLPRIVGRKKLPDGCVQLIFSKKKYPHETFEASFWFEELGETIRYRRSMQKMLESLGYKTNPKMKLKSQSQDKSK